MRKCLLALACLVAFSPLPALADQFPTKPVTILVPYAPGSATDLVARVIAEQLRQIMHQPFIVENKPGAFGILAIQELVRMPADGYTMMIGNISTNVITPILFAAKIPFDYRKSVRPVSEIGELPQVLAALPSFPPNTVAEAIDYMKAHRGKIRFASAGIGSFPQFDFSMLAIRGGLDPAKDLIHVPMRGGGGDMVNSLATGDTQISFLNFASAIGMLKAGTLKPYAVTTTERLPGWPDIPTMAEAGYPGIGTNNWQAVYVRMQTPPPILDALFNAIVEAAHSPEAAKVFVPASERVATSDSLQQATQWNSDESKKWQDIVRETRLQLD
jgi:tripartite-type tricarboxylate transporter receptor subunit TctC